MIATPGLSRRRSFLDALLRFWTGKPPCIEITAADRMALNAKRIPWNKPGMRWNTPPEVSVLVDLSDLDAPRRLRTDLEGRVVEIGRRVG